MSSFPTFNLQNRLRDFVFANQMIHSKVLIVRKVNNIKGIELKKKIKKYSRSRN